MEINVREHIIRIQIIEIDGRLDVASVQNLRDLQDKLIADDNKHFIVDLQKTQFMDSAGMSSLVSLLKKARQAGGDVVLVKPKDEAAYRILTLTRFDKVFVITDTIEQAQGKF